VSETKHRLFWNTDDVLEAVMIVWKEEEDER
jgi:hypothetical protein